MKEKTIGIVLKLIAVAVFIGGIIGGGYLAYNALTGESYTPEYFAVGIALVLFSVFVIASIVPWIAHFDGHADWEIEEGKVNVAGSLKAGLTFTFFAACLVFVFIGISAWMSKGIWQLGIAAIAVLVLMIIIATEASIRFQTRESRRVEKDKNATLYSGRIISIDSQFGIFLFGKTKHFIRVFILEIDGVKSKALIRSSSRYAKNLFEGDTVTVLFNPRRPRYCAIAKEKA